MKSRLRVASFMIVISLTFLITTFTNCSQHFEMASLDSDKIGNRFAVDTNGTTTETDGDETSTGSLPSASAGNQSGSGSTSSGQVNSGGSSSSNRKWFGQNFQPAISNAQTLGLGLMRTLIVTSPGGGRTGDWWCTNHFGNNLGKVQKCFEVSGGKTCTTDVPYGHLVTCAELRTEQLTVDAGSAGAGRTGDWWCANHFGNNYGGQWICGSVNSSADACSRDVDAGQTVRCGQNRNLSRVGFEPVSCADGSLDSSEREFCQYTQYMNRRSNNTMYLTNDYLRVGVNHHAGGAIFEFYGGQRRNMIQQHGGAAMQLSLWGYGTDTDTSRVFYYLTNRCDPHPRSDAQACKAENGGVDCFPAGGGGLHMANCQSVQRCGSWAASAPINPIQAQAENCGWDGEGSRVNGHSFEDDMLIIQKSNPYNFTKSNSASGLTWTQRVQVKPDVPYARVEYFIENNGPSLGPHPQEIPAIFLNRAPDHFTYYFYQGDQAYLNSNSAVRMGPYPGKDQDVGLPGRTLPSHIVDPYRADEHWYSACRQDGSCITIAAFDEPARWFSLNQQYITLLGYFGMPTGFRTGIRIYIFPYRFDAVVGGRTVRQWIYDLRPTS